jgi:hypothetical protein
LKRNVLKARNRKNLENRRRMILNKIRELPDQRVERQAKYLIHLHRNFLKSKNTLVKFIK